MQNWSLIIASDIGTENMKKDISLFNSHENGNNLSMLSIYSWSKPCISLGYSQIIDEEIDIYKAASLGWDVVRRPTGGGIVFHNTSEVTYSIVTSKDNEKLPNGLVASYKIISEAIVLALNSLGIEAKIGHIKPKEQCMKPNLCFSYPTEYEIVANGKKIVGSAQKRGKRSLLQQGSIFMSPIDKEVFNSLKQPYLPYNAISIEEMLGEKVSFDQMSAALVNGFVKHLGVTFV